MKALFLIADGFEDLEFFYPFFRVKEAEFEVDVAGPEAGKIEGKHGYPFQASKSFSDVNADEYDFLVLPGGMGPEKVRVNDDAVNIVKEIWNSGKIVATICHGIQILISAGVLEGKKAACWPALKDDLNAAGGQFEDKEVVVDGQLVSSRKPADLPAFCRELFRVLESEKVHAGSGHANV
jgi:protease I